MVVEREGFKTRHHLSSWENILPFLKLSWEVKRHPCLLGLLLRIDVDVNYSESLETT